MRVWTLALAALLSLGGASAVQAQAERDGGWEVVRRGGDRDRERERDEARERRRDRDGGWVIGRDRRDRDDDDDDDWYDDDDDRRRGNGPAFCRSGQGHPVFGRQWCRDKGFGVRNDRWNDVTWRDVILRQPRRESDVLGRGGIIDVLGDVVFDRVERRFDPSRNTAPLTGRWFRDGRRTGLLLQLNGRTVGQLVDTNGDRRADLIRFLDR